MPTNVKDQWGNTIDAASMKPVYWNGAMVGYSFQNPLTGARNFVQTGLGSTGTGSSGMLEFLRQTNPTAAMVAKQTSFGPIHQQLTIDGQSSPVWQQSPDVDPTFGVYSKKKAGTGFADPAVQTLAALAGVAAGGALAGGALAGGGGAAGAGAGSGAGAAGAGIGATGSGGAGGIALSPAAAAAGGGAGAAGAAGAAGGGMAGGLGALTWGDIAMLGGSAISGLTSLAAADKQSDAANAAANAAMAQYGQTRADLMPWMIGGRMALNDLVNPSLDKFHADPGYQFNLQEGLDAINKRAAASHDYYAPQTLRDVSGFAQGLASNEYGNYWNRLFAMSGTGQNAAAQTGAFGANATNMAGQAGMAGANAQAAGLVGASNALTGGIGDVYNAWLTREILGQSQRSLYG